MGVGSSGRTPDGRSAARQVNKTPAARMDSTDTSRAKDKKHVDAGRGRGESTTQGTPPKKKGSAAPDEAKPAAPKPAAPKAGEPKAAKPLAPNAPFSGKNKGKDQQRFDAMRGGRGPSAPGGSAPRRGGQRGR